MSMRELRTTVSVPDQQTVVLGGFVDTIAPGAKAAGPAGVGAGEKFVEQLMTPAGPAAELFMLVRPRIIIADKAVTRPASLGAR